MTPPDTAPDLREAHRAHVVEGCPWCAVFAVTEYRLPSTPLAEGRLDMERLRDAALLVLQSQRVSMRKQPLALAIALNALRVALASEDTP